MTVTHTTSAPLPRSDYGALVELVANYIVGQHWWERNGDGEPTPIDREAITIRSANVLAPGRPGLISVVAEFGESSIHAVLGLRSAGDEMQFLAESDVPPLGVFEDADGLAVVFDAMFDAESAVVLLASLSSLTADRDRVRRAWLTDDSVSLTFDDRLALTVFQRFPRPDRPHRGIEMFLALDDVGFNHLSAPCAHWRWGDLDLGIVQEYEAGAAGGWALALTSLRDLYASGGPPEHAGADFGLEAKRLGEMTARMHLGLDQAFGRKSGNAAQWVLEVEEAVRAVDESLLENVDVRAVLDELRSSSIRCVAIRTHGDFHLGRVAQTEIGWFVLDFSPGGTPVFTAGTVAEENQIFRSPLADVADMLWSFRHVADVAAAERDPSGQLGLLELAGAWEVRNRRAFLAGYLATPGIGGLVPANRDMVRKLVAAFELERSASKLAIGVP